MKLAELWKTEEWKQNKAAFLKTNPICVWCGSPSSIPHHPQKPNSISDKEYLSLRGGIPLCQRCHYAAKKGLKLCPLCKKNYYKPKRKREKICWSCFIQTPSGKEIKKWRDKQEENV